MRDEGREIGQFRAQLWVPALVAGLMTVGGIGVNYWLSERAKAAIEASRLSLEKGRSHLEEARLALDRVRLDVEKTRVETERTRQVNEEDRHRRAAEVEGVRARSDQDRVRLDEARLRIERARQETEEMKKAIEEGRPTNDATRTKTDETRLTVDLSRFLGDLTPKLDLNCGSAWKQVDRIEVKCDFRNRSVHTVRIQAPTIFLEESAGRTTLPEDAFTSLFVEGNTVLAAGNVSNVYEIVVGRDWERKFTPPIRVRLQFIARSDPTIIAIAKRTAAGHVPAAEVEELAKQQYTLTVGNVKPDGR